MNIRRIEVFVSVYKHGSLTAAAQQLSLTKSAISQSLSLLEEELKTPLFIRESRKLIPTQTAESLYGNISPLIDSMFQVYKSVSAESPQTVGSIRIGVPPDFASSYMIPLLAEFVKIYPGVQCQLQLGTPLLIGPKLMKNELDFAIIDASDVFEKTYPISTQPLTQERHVLVCSKSYLKTRHLKDLTYEAFCDERFVAYTPDAIEIKFWCKHHFKKVPRNLEVTMVVDQVMATKTAIMHGFGFGHVPERLVEKEIKKGELWVWPTRTEKYENKIAIAQLAGKKPGRIEKETIRFISEYFRKNHLSKI